MKLLQPLFQLDEILKSFLQVEFKQIVLVLGHNYHRILNEMKKVPPHVNVVIHRKPERGPGSALSVGLQAINHELQGIVIAQGDQLVESQTLQLLIQAFEKEIKKNGKKKIFVPVYHGKQGFPWVISSELRKPLSELEGNLALSVFLKNRRKDVLAVSC